MSHCKIMLAVMEQYEGTVSFRRKVHASVISKGEIIFGKLAVIFRDSSSS